jgi:ribosomal protein S18 acetylase RimI-like enzyme
LIELQAGLKVRYVCGDEALLDEVADLWAQLRQHHLDRTHDFRSFYEELTFEKRKVVLLKKAAHGKLYIEMALDDVTGKPVGYVAVTINEDKVGEFESVYVAHTYRELGVGGTLFRNCLAWLDQQGAEKKIVEVAVGNEAAFGFYRQFGFLPRKIVLEQK